MSAAESVVSLIQHYQKSIQKYHGNSARILHCIRKLYDLPVSVQHLQDTGVGKTINSLRKSDGDVGEAARGLVAKWKQMVEEESENEQDNHAKSHSSHNGDSGNESNRERSEKRNKESTVKSSKDYDSRDHSRSDHSKSHKRRRDSENDQYREKKQRNERMSGMSSQSSNSGGKLNGNSEGSDEEWTADKYVNDVNSENESDIRNSQIKKENTPSEDGNYQFSDDDLNTSEFLSPSTYKESRHLKEESDSRHDKSSKKEKSSHKHKHKSTSSSTEKSKHSSSSRNEHKESKSSSNSRHKDEKSSSSSNTKKEGNNSSERSEDKLKSKDKDRKDKHKDKHRSKDEKKKEKKEKKKDETEEDGLDSNSGKSFGEALGMMFAPDKPKKKSSSGASSSQSPSKKKSRTTSSAPETKTHPKDIINSSPEAERDNAHFHMEPSLDVDEDFGLPTLNPNYKPLPQPNFYNSPPKRYQNDEDDLSNIMYSKVQRTKVFSGNKSGYTFVPSLFDLCIRVLQENIDALEFTGGVPFDLLKPVLERATADQLFTLEHYNAYLIEDTDMIWEYHCKKEFRTKKREELETWREMYMRCREEREMKLKSLTANIAASSKAKLLPVRKTQLAYIESAVKPPRNIARKQAKFGTGAASSSSASSKQDSSGLSSSFTGRSSLVQSGPAVAVPAPRGASGGGGAHSTSCKPKPKAPLMQKALKLIKQNRFKR